MADETKHSPEPWVMDEWGHPTHDGGRPVLLSGFSLSAGVARGETLENDRRIVACVNACAGIPTEALEAGALAKALDLFVDTALQMACGCGHPACNRCADERENAAALRALGRL